MVIQSLKCIDIWVHGVLIVLLGGSSAHILLQNYLGNEKDIQQPLTPFWISIAIVKNTTINASGT